MQILGTFSKIKTPNPNGGFCLPSRDNKTGEHNPMKLKIFATGLLVGLIPVCGHASFDSYSEYSDFNEYGSLQCSTNQSIVRDDLSKDPEGQYRWCDAFGVQGFISGTDTIKTAVAPYQSWSVAQQRGCASQRKRIFYISSSREQNADAPGLPQPVTIGSCRVVTVYDCNSCKSGYTKHTYDASALFYFSDSQTSTSTWSGLAQDGTDDYGNIKNPFSSSDHWHYACIPNVQTCEAPLIQECKTLSAGGSTCKERYGTCTKEKCKIIHPVCKSFSTSTSEYASGSRVCVEEPDNYWEACKLGYYRSAVGNYDSANGWYKNITCTKCPATGMTTPATGSTVKEGDDYPDLTSTGADSAEHCYIPGGTTGSDTTGTLIYIEDCGYIK